MSNINVEIRDKALFAFSSSDLSPSPHIHKEIEVVYIKKGKASCYADNMLYTAKDGDIFIAFPNQIHYYTNSEIGEYYVLIFSADIIYNLKDVFFENIPANNIIHTSENNTISKLINGVINENGEFKETVRAGILNQLMPMFLSQTELKHKIETNSTTLKKIFDYCTQNYSSTITLDSVSNALHFSKFHISRLLNEKLNIGFNRYINTIRINEALYLMKDKDKSLAYISQEVGFGSIRSFNRAFMQIMNATPTSYIKQIREPKITVSQTNAKTAENISVIATEN